MLSNGPENTAKNPARIEALINSAFKREVIRKVVDVVVPLNDIGDGPPFYCIHSIAGVATEYQDLVRMLGPNRKFYGIQVPSDRRNADFARSIEELSKYYVDELVKFQPEGTFLLGGYSVGATIALEMSQQLIARGREVDLLVVFDGELFNTGAEITARNPLYWLKLLTNAPRWIVHEHGSFAKKAATRVKSATFKTCKNNRQKPPAVERFIDLKGFLPEHSAFIGALFDSHRDYVPSRYLGRVFVFVVKTHPLSYLRQVKAAWTKIAPSSEVFEISCTHLKIMKMPHVRAVAERLSKKIAEVGEQILATPMDMQ
jgi:thioesterase domain-containing protein